LVILNILVHCFARMSSPSHLVSPHQNFCESFTCMSNLLKWYKEEFLKCINKEYDSTIERLDRLHELENLNVKYWENIQDLSSN